MLFLGNFTRINRSKPFKFGSHECVSAGILFYRFNEEKEVEYLFQYKSDKKGKIWRYEDLGGKHDRKDNSVEEIAAREAAEETNSVFVTHLMNKESMNRVEYVDIVSTCKDYIMKLIDIKSISLINPKSKYVLYIVHLPNNINYDFGTTEIHPKYNITRYINWMTLKEIRKKKYTEFHPRIRTFIKFLS